MRKQNIENDAFVSMLVGVTLVAVTLVGVTPIGVTLVGLIRMALIRAGRLRRVGRRLVRLEDHNAAKLSKRVEMMGILADKFSLGRLSTPTDG